MYSNKFIASVIVDGNILQEKSNGVTPIPFGSEYSLRLRNKHSRRCAAEIYIDGKCATKIGKIIINANDFADIERFIDQKDSGRKFKFVSKDSPMAEDAGKDKLDKYEAGTIEVKFFLEKKKVKRKELIIEKHIHHDHYYNYPQYTYGPIWFGDSTVNPLSINCSANKHDEVACAATFTTNSSCFTSNVEQTPKELKEGVSVEGSYSDQSFGSSYIDLESECTVIRLQLMGVEPIMKEKQLELFDEAEIIVKRNDSFCSKCGAQRLKNDNFCGKCGNKLK